MMLVHHFLERLTAPAILIGLALGSLLCSAQETGDAVHVTATGGVMLRATDGDEETAVPFGRMFQIEKVSADQFQVRYQGKSWHVNQQDVMLPENALKFIDQELEQDSTVDNHFFKTHVLYTLRKFDEAIEASNEALKIDPDHVGTLHYRAIASFYLNDFEEAEVLLEKLMKLAPDQHLTYAIEYYLMTNDVNGPLPSMPAKRV